MNTNLRFYVNLNSSYFVKLMFVALTLLTGSAKEVPISTNLSLACVLGALTYPEIF